LKPKAHRLPFLNPGLWAFLAIIPGFLTATADAAQTAGQLASAAPAAPAAAAEGGSVAIEEGVLGAAHYAIALPAARWNHRLLLIAHGFRPESSPLLPDLHPARESNRTLLDEGWIVATTSYRRNGVIIGDAIADLEALRAHIASSHGDLDRVIVEGDSMGGLIATIIAERDPDHYAGAVAFCATLYAKEANPAVGLSLLPHIPLLFVTNRSELAGTKAYVSVITPTSDGFVHPQLWVISRDGHVNINERERLGALRAINAWIDSNSEALPRPAGGVPFFDATVPPDPSPSKAIPMPDHRGFATRVAEVSAIDGQLTLEAQPSDFAAAGITPMTFFKLVTKGAPIRVLYGRDFGNVRRGQWIVISDPEGHTILSRNYENAAASAHIKAGDFLTLVRYEGP